MFVPEIKGILRSNIVRMPEIIRTCSGIKVFGKKIKSFIFTTDVAVIKNTNADAIMAVYPFTPQPLITQAIVAAADVPVFCGVGGGITSGKRVVNLGLDAEFKGAMGIVVNNPIPNEIITALTEVVDIPVVVTVVSDKEDVLKRIESGASILNVSGAANTANIVRKIRSIHSSIPIIATGGPNEKTIEETIKAGANAITYTPSTNLELLSVSMRKYRENYD